MTLKRLKYEGLGGLTFQHLDLRKIRRGSGVYIIMCQKHDLHVLPSLYSTVTGGEASCCVPDFSAVTYSKYSIVQESFIPAPARSCFHGLRKHLFCHPLQAAFWLASVPPSRAYITSWKPDVWFHDLTSLALGGSLCQEAFGTTLFKSGALKSYDTRLFKFCTDRAALDFLYEIRELINLKKCIETNN